jgi:hypothetical protein
MPYMNDEPTVESLSQRIDELEKIIRDMKSQLDRIVREKSQLPPVPQVVSPGSLGEKTLSIGQITKNPHDPNDTPRVWERVRDAR